MISRGSFSFWSHIASHFVVRSFFAALVNFAHKEVLPVVIEIPRISIASLAREAQIDYQRCWKAYTSGGAWTLTRAEASRLQAVLEKRGLSLEKATAPS